MKVDRLSLSLQLGSFGNLLAEELQQDHAQLTAFSNRAVYYFRRAGFRGLSARSTDPFIFLWQSPTGVGCHPCFPCLSTPLAECEDLKTERFVHWYIPPTLPQAAWKGESRDKSQARGTLLFRLLSLNGLLPLQSTTFTLNRIQNAKRIVDQSSSSRFVDAGSRAVVAAPSLFPQVAFLTDPLLGGLPFSHPLSSALT